MAPPVAQPSLTVMSGSMGGTVFVVDDSVDNILIGSDASCGFSLPGTGVDPIHARLWIDLDGITVYDVNSRGVYINDDRVQGQARLRHGDILWLGAPGEDKSVMLQCRLTGAVSPAPPTVLAPDAIQPEPPVLRAPDDAFLEPDLAVAMLPDDLELTAALEAEDDPAAALLDEPPPLPKAPPAMEPAHLEPPPLPKGHREAPVAPPTLRRERPAAVPIPRRGAPMGLLIPGGLLAAAAVAAGGWWMLTRGPAAPQPGTDTPPPTVADVSPAAPPPSAAAGPEGTLPAPAAEGPIEEEVLEEEVTIVPLPSPTEPPAPDLDKAFIPGGTVVETQAPEFRGRIEFAVSPPRVKPGDAYTVGIYLVNEGRKAIQVSGLSVSLNVNGFKSDRSMASRVKEVKPAQRALLEELPGEWPAGVEWWSAEVTVTANRDDSLKNLLTWK
jgi:hypothetical protein